MGGDSRKKPRQELKRQRKRTSQRRTQSSSEYLKLQHAGEIEACVVNSDWKEQGLASLYSCAECRAVTRWARTGRHLKIEWSGSSA
ncbi:MAG TPA: hypothetical protein PLS23_19965 [Phycisphaerae bacterium]|nr:hypothetical protein [Phycisphaerae bacterium]